MNKREKSNYLPSYIVVEVPVKCGYALACKIEKLIISHSLLEIYLLWYGIYSSFLKSYCQIFIRPGRSSPGRYGMDRREWQMGSKGCLIAATTMY